MTISSEYKLAVKLGFKKQVDKIIYDNSHSISPEFMGFLDIYRHISQIIPKNRIIVDLGCAYGIQAIYFLKHKKYIGVDMMTHTDHQLCTQNSDYFNCKIADFCTTYSEEIIKHPHFAICSYVPPWHHDNGQIVRTSFTDVFVYYPNDENVSVVLKQSGMKLKREK